MPTNLSFQELQNRRQAYAYPAVALTGALGNFQERAFASTIALDDYHGDLLRLGNDAAKVMGYLSIVFWGHYSGQEGRQTPNRALGKVNLAYVGAPRKDGRRISGICDADNGVASASQTIASSVASLRQGDYASAIAELSTLRQIKIAFASKICAFAQPSHCGVIDSVIAARCPNFGFKIDNLGFLKNTRDNQQRYNSYCQWLQQKADELNSSGAYSTWVDRDGARQSWRAVDVERALY